MPNRDGTGPEGRGPKTGRGQGNCGSAKNSGNRPMAGRGRGLGLGLGRKSNQN